MTTLERPPVTPTSDDDFLQRVLQGAEPRDHLGNIRLAWTCYRRLGYVAGLLATEGAIRARAERSGGSWDRDLTRCWYDRVVTLASRHDVDFARFVDDNRAALLAPLSPAQPRGR